MSERIQEALGISGKVIGGIETGVLKPSRTALMCLRMARLMDDSESVAWLMCEISGYPRSEDLQQSSHAFEIAAHHGRVLEPAAKGHVFLNTAASLEARIEVYEAEYNIEVTSKAPLSSDIKSVTMQELQNQSEEKTERRIKNLMDSKHKLEILRFQYYDYALRINRTIRFSGCVESIFGTYRLQADAEFARLAPSSIKKLDAVYDDLSSDNPESWHEALVSCRRLIEEISNALFDQWHVETSTETTYTCQSGRSLEIEGDKYINRLYATLDKFSVTKTARRMVGSQIVYATDLIEDIYKAVCKGTHSLDPITFEEAQAVVIHTYILLGDLAILCHDLDEDNLARGMSLGRSL